MFERIKDYIMTTGPMHLGALLPPIFFTVSGMLNAIQSILVFMFVEIVMLLTYAGSDRVYRCHDKRRRYLALLMIVTFIVFAFIMMVNLSNKFQ